MSVTFVVEDGTGKSDATSYVSVAGADQIILDYGLTWPSGSSDAYIDEQKEIALNIGTRYLDTRFNTKWKGRKNSEDQALAWPRVNVVDSDGWIIDNDVIPSQIEQATVEVAVYFSESGKAFPDLDDEGTISEKKIKIDVIEIHKKFLGGNAGSQIANKVDAILCGFLRGRGANVEVQRG
jgi:hypothetical protein